MKFYLCSNTYRVVDKINFEGKTNMVCIQNAADPYEDKYFVQRDLKAIQDKGISVSQYDLKFKKYDQLAEDLSKFDIIFVSGGNTFLLLDYVKKSGFDKYISNNIDANKIYIGSSAGSIITGPDIEFIGALDHPEIVPDLENTKGLNLFDGYIIPHLGNPKYDKTIEKVSNKYKDLNLIKITDYQLVYFENGKYKII